MLVVVRLLAEGEGEGKDGFDAGQGCCRRGDNLCLTSLPIRPAFPFLPSFGAARRFCGRGPLKFARKQSAAFAQAELGGGGREDVLAEGWRKKGEEGRHGSNMSQIRATWRVWFLRQQYPPLPACVFSS